MPAGATCSGSCKHGGTTHAYYPQHASNNEEAGTVKVHLLVHTDGVIWIANAAESSGSPSLDAAAANAFRGGFVRPFPAGVPEAALDVSVHYVLAYRRDQPATAGYTPASSGRPFTITNQPVHSPILETMLQKACTGSVVKQGIRNHPWYGSRYQVEAVFFRRLTAQRGSGSMTAARAIAWLLSWKSGKCCAGRGQRST